MLETKINQPEFVTDGPNAGLMIREIDSEFEIVAESLEGGPKKNDLGGLANELKARPEIASYLGFSFEVAEDGVVAHCPNIHRLNEIKSSLESDGVNRGVFVESEGGELRTSEYANFLRKGEIPIAREPGHRIHDLSIHALGFMMMSQGMFSELQKSARSELRRSRTFPSALYLIGFIDFETYRLAANVDRYQIFGASLQDALKSTLLKGVKVKKLENEQDLVLDRLLQRAKQKRGAQEILDV